VQKVLTLIQGDMRSWKCDKPFDLIFSPGSSMCHLLSLEDQLSTWRRAWEKLVSGGRFIVDVSMPAHAAYADSFLTPPREVVEVDRDTSDPETGERLIR